VGDNFCDDNCVCSNNECFEAYGTGYGSSDGIFYISWAGHDLSGTMLKSSTMRLSRYSLYSVSSVSGQLGKFIDGLKGRWYGFSQILHKSYFLISINESKFCK
jgi:hypothetical protein